MYELFNICNPPYGTKYFGPKGGFYKGKEYS